jgi:hypothetical protein
MFGNGTFSTVRPSDLMMLLPDQMDRLDTLIAKEEQHFKEFSKHKFFQATVHVKRCTAGPGFLPSPYRGKCGTTYS